MASAAPLCLTFSAVNNEASFVFLRNNVRLISELLQVEHDFAYRPMLSSNKEGRFYDRICVYYVFCDNFFRYCCSNFLL